MLRQAMIRVATTIRQRGLDRLLGIDAPSRKFHSNAYLRHNARRLEHLASLRIAVSGMTVLELGAGIGDHSHYYIDRGCKITITDARTDNLKYLKHYYPDFDIQFLDIENPSCVNGAPFDIVHCYGLLYHVARPKEALIFISSNTNKMLFLETCVSFGNDVEINPIRETSTNPTQASSGIGCRPTREWLFRELKGLFEYVYLPITQPNHEEFPIDWSAPEKHGVRLKRAVFIASREPLENELLTESMLVSQIRHE